MAKARAADPDRQAVGLTAAASARASRLPRPTPLDFELEREAEGADRDDSGEHRDAGESRFDRHSVDDVGGDEQFEAEQDGSAEIGAQRLAGRDVRVAAAIFILGTR